MNFKELEKTIKRKNSMDINDIQRFSEICENYKQAMTAFELSKKFCSQPSCELLEIVLEYAVPELINDVIYESEELIDSDARDAIVADAIKYYDAAVLSSIHKVRFGRNIPDYGLGYIKKIYEQSPDKSASKGLALDKIVSICEFLLEEPLDYTEFRIEKITKLNINDPNILRIKTKAEKILAEGGLR